MRGPYGEEYEHFEDREAKFRKIDMLARERKFDQLKDARKSQQCCAICVEDFTDKDIIRETQCHHVFHSHCLMTWGKSKLWSNLTRVGIPSCPNCNASLIEQQKIAKVAPVPIYMPGLDSGTEQEQSVVGTQNQQLLNNSISVTNSVQPVNNIDINGSDGRQNHQNYVGNAELQDYRLS